MLKSLRLSLSLFILLAPAVISSYTSPDDPTLPFPSQCNGDGVVPVCSQVFDGMHTMCEDRVGVPGTHLGLVREQAVLDLVTKFLNQK